MIGDIPQISAGTYSNTSYGLGSGSITGDCVVWDGTTTAVPQAHRGVQLMQLIPSGSHTHFQVEKEDMADNKTRLVRVVIVDPNENLSLADRLVYSGDEKFTDLTDQELFFELDIKSMLASHNEKRVKAVDKSVKERTQYLEPARVRDLKMVVVNIATF
jgi:hypothetical protein